MPEILEVERYRVLAEKALHRPIVKVWMIDARYGRGGTTPQRLRAALVGRQFTAARRRGKLMLLDIEDGPTLGVRFGMTGGLVVDGQQALDRLRYGPGVFEKKWVRARMDFADGGLLELHDPRRFGSLELAPDENRLGPDALSATLADVRTALAVPVNRAGPVAPVKARLMDQERLAGIGNLLADEILWRAGIDPARRTPLDEDELRTLHKAMRSTLRQVDRKGGSHMGDLMEQRVPGGHCPRDGAELIVAQVGGRTTYWCPLHQH
ncbi:MAG TPA: DNA-formamidopyrimidine glycosylase family protein [Acidimicrobiales bacterium]